MASDLSQCAPVAGEQRRQIGTPAVREIHLHLEAGLIKRTQQKFRLPELVLALSPFIKRLDEEKK